MSKSKLRIIVNLSGRKRIYILILIGYGARKRNYKEVSYLFNDINPQRPPRSRFMVSKTSINENKTLDVLLIVKEMPKHLHFKYQESMVLA